jgi:hypothetical protein
MEGSIISFGLQCSLTIQLLHRAKALFGANTTVVVQGIHTA